MIDYLCKTNPPIMKRLFALFTIGLTIAGCGEKNNPEEKKLEVTPASITLNADETCQITTNAKKPAFMCADTYYASVDASGLVKAKLIGTTEIAVTSNMGDATIPVTVTPKYNLYPEVDGIVGKDIEAMKAVMGSDYRVLDGAAGTGTAGQALYTYKGESEYIDAIAFTFNNGKCDKIAVAVLKANYDMALKHLMERYIIVGKKGDEYAFTNHDKTVEIGLKDYSDTYWAVGYQPK